MIFPRHRVLLGLAAAALITLRCASAPRPTAGMLALAGNARAVVEGQVVDRSGAPVSGIAVLGLPRGKDIGWSHAAVTDADGQFRLSLYAPAEYGFLLRWRGRTVVTADPDDPARMQVAVAPGQSRTGIRLLFLREEWERNP